GSLALRKICAEGCRLPRGDLFLPRIELGAEALQSRGSQQKSERRVGRFDDSNHGMDSTDRISCLPAILVAPVVASVACGGIVIFNTLCRYNARASEEVGAEGARFDSSDTNAERCDFGGERFRESLDCKFGALVITPAGRGGKPADRRQIEDVSAALLAHVGEQSTRDADEAEDIGVEDRHVFVFRSLLDGSDNAVSGVVDENINRAKTRHSLGNNGVDLSGVGDIQCESPCPARILLFEIGYFIQIAGCGNDLAPCLEDLFGKNTAEPGGGSGDKPCAGCGDVCHIP